MHKQIFGFFLIVLVFLAFGTPKINASTPEPMILDDSDVKYDMYPSLEVVKDYELELTIDDILTDEYMNQFLTFDLVDQAIGFFPTGNWLRFDITNNSSGNDWLLEFAFPLINKLEIYEFENGKANLLYESGSDLPFSEREINHRHFILNLDIAPGETKSYYALAVGSGDLHPPINVW